MQTVRKTIAFPVIAIKKAESKASQIGMDFTEYMRYLLAKDIEDTERIPSAEPRYYLSERTERALERAEKAYAQGKTKTYTSAKDLMKDILK